MLCVLFYMNEIVLFVSSLSIFLSSFFFCFSPFVLFAFRFGKIARITRITQNLHYTALMGNLMFYSRNKYKMPLYICTWICSTMSKSSQGARIQQIVIFMTLNQMAFDWFRISWLILLHHLVIYVKINQFSSFVLFIFPQFK